MKRVLVTGAGGFVVGQHPGLGLELVLSVDVGRGEGQRLRQRPPLRHVCIH